jgi:hypothetical protein
MAAVHFERPPSKPKMPAGSNSGSRRLFTEAAALGVPLVAHGLFLSWAFHWHGAFGLAWLGYAAVWAFALSFRQRSSPASYLWVSFWVALFGVALGWLRMPLWGIDDGAFMGGLSTGAARAMGNGAVGDALVAIAPPLVAGAAGATGVTLSAARRRPRRRRNFFVARAGALGRLALRRRATRRPRPREPAAGDRGGARPPALEELRRRME